MAVPVNPSSAVDPSLIEGVTIIALGSNLAGAWPSSQTLLEAALDRIDEAGFSRLARSSWWRSSAWPRSGDPAFINGVALFRSDGEPHETLARLLQIERDFGRVREGDNAARTLDLDLIAHGRDVSPDERLILPHPRAHERLFVMGPLAEVAPGWRHPVLRETAAALAARARIGTDARSLDPAPLRRNGRDAI